LQLHLRFRSRCRRIAAATATNIGRHALPSVPRGCGAAAAWPAAAATSATTAAAAAAAAATSAWDAKFNLRLWHVPVAGQGAARVALHAFRTNPARTTAGRLGR